MDLLDSMEEDIAEYKAAYELTGLNVSTKAHVIFEHVAEFCRTHGKSLGHFSEQARYVKIISKMQIVYRIGSIRIRGHYYFYFLEGAD